MKSSFAFLLSLFVTQLSAADLTVRLTNAPDAGDLVFQVYDAADKFRDFRDPVQTIAVPAAGDGEYLLSEVGGKNVALLVYHDQNANGRIDKNFIGIPRERLALPTTISRKGRRVFREQASIFRRQMGRTLTCRCTSCLANVGALASALEALAEAAHI